MTVTGQAPARSAGRAGVLLVAAAVLLGAVFSAIGASLRHVTGELGFMREVDRGPSAVVTTVCKALSDIGSQAVLVPITIVLCVLLAVHRALRTAVFVAVAAAGGIALSNVIKVIVDRPRPPLVHLVHVASSSFPSGHATQTAAILPALAIGAVAFGARRATALAIAVAASLLIGVSRVLLGVHYPTDVLAGWLLGGAWVAIAYLALLPEARPSADRRR